MGRGLPTLSYSGYRAYSECPLRWKFQYIDHLQEAPRGYFSFGRSMHSALEKFVEPLVVGVPPSAGGPRTQTTLLDFGGPAEAPPAPPQPMTVERLLSIYHDVWVNEGYVSPDEERKYYELGEDLLRRYHRSYLAEPPRPLAVEQDLRARLEGVDIHGIVDRVDRAPGGGLEVVDYKTTRELSQRDAKESDQLTLYQVLVEENYREPVESLTLYHLRSLSPLRSSRREPGEVRDLGLRLGEAADGIRAEAYDPTPGPHCKWCEFRHLCPEFRDIPTAERSRVSELVERYRELKEDEAELQERLRATEDELHAAGTQLGVHRLPGRATVVYRRPSSSWEYPPDQVLPVLEGTPLVSRPLRVDREEVARMVRDGDVPPEVRRGLAATGRRSVRWRLEIDAGPAPTPRRRARPATPEAATRSTPG